MFSGRVGVVWFLLCGPSLLAQTPRASVVRVRSAPEAPIIEVRDQTQFVNLDLIVTSQADVPLRISEIQMSVFDSSGQLVLRKGLNTDAIAPSIEIIGARVLHPGETLDIFNPFSQFESIVPLTKLRYSICLLKESNAQEEERNRHRLPGDCDFRSDEDVIPRRYEPKADLVLPLKGKIFVWEGHDFLAHHLRVPLGNPKLQKIGITANSNEFASDFIYVDDNGRPYRGNPGALENWYSYGKPIYAPGAGTVVATANDIPENSFADSNATSIVSPKLPPGKDPKDLGNFVLIDHQDGEYSLLLHMKPGSVRVKAGDRVRQGQPIGEIGFAGDAIFPHLHYSVMDGPEVFKAWGLPAYFSNFRRVLGTKSVKVKRGPVNSGDFLESEFSHRAQ